MAGRYTHNPDPQLAELLHQVSLDGWANDSAGDVNQDGVHASLLIVEAAEQQELAGAFDQPIPAGNWVLVEDEQGFVTLDEYPSPHAARQAFTRPKTTGPGPGKTTAPSPWQDHWAAATRLRLPAGSSGYAADLEQAKAMLRAAMDRPVLAGCLVH